MGFMEFLGWVFVWLIIFSLLFTPGGLAVLYIIALVALTMLPIVALVQLARLGDAAKDKEEK